MSTFSEVQGAAKPGDVVAPPRICTLPPTAFHESWHRKPTHPVPIGLRAPSARDHEVARAEATKRAFAQLADKDGKVLDHESYIESYNDALMMHVVARCATDPSDVAVPFLEMAEDALPLAVTSQGIARLYDEVLALLKESSPLGREIEPEEMAELAARVRGAPDLPEVRQVKRLLAYALDRLCEFGPAELEVEVEADEEAEIAVYHARAASPE